LSTSQPEYPESADGKSRDGAVAARPQQGPGARGRAEPPLAQRRVGGGLFFWASLLTQGSALLRYVALARLLGPEQLGIAATLLITATFFDLISDTGSDRFLVQDRHGDTREVQDIVQFVWVARGLAIAAALVLFAAPIAGFYQTPRLAQPFALLALSPLIQGFLHLDVKRAQRNHNFRPQAISMIVGESASLIATVVAAGLTHDYTAILYGLITRAIVSVGSSHLLAERPYRLAWRPEHARRLGAFAMPLMFNGFLLFLASQGERAIIGDRMGPTALGYYSVVAQLIFYPAGIVANYIHAIYIPMVAAERDAPAERDRVSDLLGGQTLVLGVAMAAGFALVAPGAVPILFGSKFAQSALLIALIGLLQTVRFLLTWPTTVALAMGRSGTVAASNLAHTIALAAGIVGLELRGDLVGLVGGMIVGEFAANAVALALVARATGRDARTLLARLGVFVAWTALILAWHLRWSVTPDVTRLVVMTAATAALTFFLLRQESAAIGQGAGWVRSRVASAWGPVRAG
jgi:lipopolysaccharide exporter